MIARRVTPPPPGDDTTIRKPRKATQRARMAETLGSLPRSSTEHLKWDNVGFVPDVRARAAQLPSANEKRLWATRCHPRPPPTAHARAHVPPSLAKDRANNPDEVHHAEGMAKIARGSLGEGFFPSPATFSGRRKSRRRRPAAVVRGGGGRRTSRPSPRPRRVRLMVHGRARRGRGERWARGAAHQKSSFFLPP